MGMLQWMTLIVFLVTIAAIVVNKLDATVAALLGVAVMVWMGTMTDVEAALLVDWNVMAILIGIWIIAVAPDPFVDVFVFQYEASQALLAGLNPYAITYTDIYGPGSGLYGPGLSDGLRTTYGFVYPPLSLILALPGYLVGDLRYAHLAATTAAGALIAYTRPSRVAAAAAALFLFTPRFLHVVEQSWTEPFAVLLIAASVFLVVRRSQLAYLTFCLFLAS